MAAQTYTHMAWKDEKLMSSRETAGNVTERTYDDTYSYV
jgi:hypothetical protein